MAHNHETETDAAASSDTGSAPNHLDRNTQLRLRYLELETALAVALEEGDPSRAEQLTRDLRDLGGEFITANLGLARSVVNPMSRHATAWTDDLLSTAVAALWEAFLRWDPARGTFGTWSRRFITGDVLREVNKTEYGMSYRDFTTRSDVLRAVHALTDSLGRDPSNDEVAAEAGVAVTQVARIRRGKPTSLDVPAGGDDSTVTRGDRLEADDAAPNANWVPYLRHTRAKVHNLLREIGKDATDATVAAQLDLQTELVAWLRGWDADDLDDPDAHIDTSELTELIGAAPRPATFDGGEYDAWLDYLKASVEDLSPREFYLVMRRDGLDGADAETLNEIAAAVGLGREMLRRAEKKARTRLTAPLPVLD